MTDQFNPSPRLGDRLEELEKELRDFGKLTRQQLLFKLARFGLKDRAKAAKNASKLRIRETSKGKVLEKEEHLYKSVRSNLRKRQGDIDGLAWSFARHGIFVERGVGKNRPIGTGYAALAAQPWLYPILNTATDNLADLLAEAYADIVAAEVVIRIPGVIDTSIK